MSSEPAAHMVDRWLTPKRGLTLLGAYFLVQALFRILISDTAELDESAQFLCVQTWAWGYGSDPPLYTWLQRLAFEILGLSIIASTVLKNLLLFATGWFTFLAAKEVLGDARLATLAAFSLLLFPQITWESQRDLTHSVLATAMAAATFLTVLRVAKNRSILNYALLGLCLGLGTLSKYSYCLFALALALAALTLPTYRRVLFHPRVLLSVLVLIVIVGLHLRWIAFSPDLALRRSQEVLRARDGVGLTPRLKGLISLLACAGMLGGVITAVYFAALFKQSKPSKLLEPTDVERWIRRTLLVISGLCVVIVLISGIKFKDRWFQPVTFLLGIWAVLLVRQRLTRGAEHRICWIIASVACAALVVLPGIPFSASLTHRPTRLNAPYAALSANLHAQFPAFPPVIVGATRWVGGNLRLFFPRSTVIVPEFMGVPVATNVAWLIVWDATKSTEPPAALTDTIRRVRGIDLLESKPVFVEAPFKYCPSRAMKLSLVVLPP